MRKLGFLTILLSGLLLAGHAVADPSEADRATARALAGEGYQALQAKDYATAADRFGRADALVHAPTLMTDWARALVGLGKFVEAQERYEQVIREGVEPKAPKSWQRALSDAGTELTALKPRLAWVTINVSGSNDARVTIDGAPVPAAALGVRRAVDPGSRSVRVAAKGYLPKKRTVDLAEGAEQQVDFTLEADPDLQEASASAEAPQAAANASGSHVRRSYAYIAFGVGGAGLLVGGITGALALGKRSELKSSDQCSGSICSSEVTTKVNAYHHYGTVSGIGLGVGVVGIGAGTVLWFLSKKGEDAPPAQGLVLHPFIGVGSVGAVGSF